MEHFLFSQLKETELPGRAVYKAIGADSFVKSTGMTYGRTRFSLDYGPMAPHHHAEEIIYVLDTKAGIVRWGDTEACTGGTLRLEAGMTLHFPAQEWHVFEFEQPDGYSEILFFYGSTTDIRPEK